MAFEDLLDSSNYEVPIKARPSLTINGVNLRIYGFELTELPDILLPPTRRRSTTLSGRHGQMSFGDLYDNWSFSVSGQIVGQNLEDVVKKQHQLIRFLDIERDQDFAIGEQNYSGLRFEISGAPLFANKGTVNVNVGSKAITGVNTLFTAYAKPGATFEVAGDSTIYTIESVQSDTGLNVNPVIARSTLTGLAYRVERRRYLLVSYNGSSSITPIADRGFNKQGGVGETLRLGYDFNFGFYTVYPYWVGDTFTRSFSNVAQDSFQSMEYVGNAPTKPVYFITGVATNPSITSGKTAFSSVYDGGTKGTGVQNNSDIAGTLLTSAKASGTASDMTFKPVSTTSKFGVSGSTTNAFYLRYSGLNINRSAFTVFAKLDYSAVTSVLVDFKSTTQTSRRFYLNSNGTNKRLSLANDQGTILSEALSTELTDGYHTVAYWINSSGRVDAKDSETYYAKMLIDGEIVATKDATFTHAMTVDYDYIDIAIRTLTLAEVHIFNHDLSDEAIREMHFSESSYRNDNNTLNYNSDLDANDVLRYNTRDTSSELFDSSLGAKINAYSSFSGTAPGLYGDDNEKDNIFVTTSSGTVNQLNVTYQPHFR